MQVVYLEVLTPALVESGQFSSIKKVSCQTSERFDMHRIWNLSWNVFEMYFYSFLKLFLYSNSYEEMVQYNINGCGDMGGVIFPVKALFVPRHFYSLKLGIFKISSAMI